MPVRSAMVASARLCGRVCVLAGLLGGAAHAAALRTSTTLHGPTVYLRDLFDDAGRNADRALGPGPDPGGRIVVPAAQLDAIARQYGVSWHSMSSADRAVLEWPGHPLDKDNAIAAARAAVAAAGAPPDADLDLPGFIPPMVPADSDPHAVASQLDYDPQSGRFTAMLTVNAPGMNPVDTRISGRVVEMIEAPVAATRLLPDSVLRPDDVRLARIRGSSLVSEIARSVDQVAGMELRRPIAAGQPLALTDLVHPPLVKRGSMVQIELSVGGLSVSGQAVALDTGAAGDRVRVQNTSSRAMIFADVSGPGRVRVTPHAGMTTAALQ
jgi:flagellar basal body P-ring formation protein FlgA